MNYYSKKMQDLKYLKSCIKIYTMTFFKKIGLLFLFAALIFTACRKDEEINGNFEPVLTIPEVIVNGSIAGTVTNTNGQAIENVTISLDGDTRLTDENGYFSFQNIEINSKGSLITMEKEGYFFNAKFVDSKLNRQNFTRVMMIEKILTATFASDAGAIVTTDDGASIQFSSNTIKQENGDIYNGSVNVYATWLDPTATDLVSRMPGDLRAINTSDEQQQLTTFGMIGLELEDDNGEALNIADGQTATIELPVPAELLGNAPETIPLWHFNETTGYWEEDGTASLQGNKYIGTVSHFSFWNCDIPNNFIYIEGLVVDRDGNPIPNITVVVTELGSGVSRSDYTDSAGSYGGAVPNDQVLIISILDNCDVEIYSEEIGPFSANATIPTITATEINDFKTITATLIDCNDNPVTDGYLKVDIGATFALLPVDAEGNVSGVLNTCNEDSIDVTGHDLIGQKQSTTTTVDVNMETLIDLETISVCDDPTEYMIFHIGDVETYDPDPYARFGSINSIPGYLRIQGTDPDPTVPSLFEFSTIANTAGTYDSSVFILGVYVGSNSQQHILQCEEMCDLTLELTTYEGIGGFAIGTFSGTVGPSGGVGVTQTVSGEFKILVQE